jgi:hypothetical protein
MDHVEVSVLVECYSIGDRFPGLFHFHGAGVCGQLVDLDVENAGALVFGGPSPPEPKAPDLFRNLTRREIARLLQFPHPNAIREKRRSSLRTPTTGHQRD